MIICPLCESEQKEGTECGVCGLPFPDYLVNEAGHSSIKTEPIEGLETTMHEVPVDAVEDNKEIAKCIWCGYEQDQGRVCFRCGMQRQRIYLHSSLPAEDLDEEKDWILCKECGFRSPPSRCINCGIRIYADDED